MNEFFNTFVTVLGALGGFKAIEWTVTFIANRKTNARKEDASADSLEIENLMKIIDRQDARDAANERRMQARDEKVDFLYKDNRRLESEKLDLVRKIHSLELQLKDERCEDQTCAHRVPPKWVKIQSKQNNENK